MSRRLSLRQLVVTIQSDPLEAYENTGSPFFRAENRPGIYITPRHIADDMAIARPVRYVLLALLAVLPVGVYGVHRADPTVGLAIGCVVLIAWSLALAFDGSEQELLARDDTT